MILKFLTISCLNHFVFVFLSSLLAHCSSIGNAQSGIGKSTWTANILENFYPILTTTPLKMIVWVTPDALSDPLRMKLKSVGDRLKIPVKIFESEGGVLGKSYQSSWKLTKKFRGKDHAMAIHTSDDGARKSKDKKKMNLKRDELEAGSDEEEDKDHAINDHDDNNDDDNDDDNDDYDNVHDGDDDDIDDDENQDICRKFLHEVIHSREFEKKCAEKARRQRKRLKELYSLKGYLPKKHPSKKCQREIDIPKSDSSCVTTPSRAKLRTPFKLREYLTLQDPSIRNASFIFEQKSPPEGAQRIAYQTGENENLVGGILTRSQTRDHLNSNEANDNEGSAQRETEAGTGAVNSHGKRKQMNTIDESEVEAETKSNSNSTKRRMKDQLRESSCKTQKRSLDAKSIINQEELANAKADHNVGSSNDNQNCDDGDDAEETTQLGTKIEGKMGDQVRDRLEKSLSDDILEKGECKMSLRLSN